MTNRLQIIALAAALSMSPALLLPSPGLAAGNEGHPRWTDHDKGQGMKHGHNMERMAEELGLTAEQKTRIEGIFQAERTATAPFREALREGQEKIHAAATAEPFDENTVRTLAEGQTAARTELIVSRARIQSQVNAILTPEQRALAEQKFSDRRRHHGPGGQPGDFPEEQ